MHVFYVQGGGLGHLTRIDKIIRILNINPKNVLIISPSSFTSFFKQYRFKPLLWRSTPTEWTHTIQQVILENVIDAFYIDTFPFGLKGELSPIFKAFRTLNYIYVSRILKWKFYCNRMPQCEQPSFNKTLLLEPLYPEHYNWVTNCSKSLIKLNLNAVNSSVKQQRLIAEPYILIIHSGGKEDVLKLCKLVKNTLDNNVIRVIVCTQVELLFNDYRFEIRTQIFPVSQYFEFAQKIYTAAGFNLINELKAYRTKHIVLPFDKLYDDQFFRRKQHTLDAQTT